MVPQALTEVRVVEDHVEVATVAVRPHPLIPGDHAPSPGRGPARLSRPKEVGDTVPDRRPTHAADRGARLRLLGVAEAGVSMTITNDAAAPAAIAMAVEEAGAGRGTGEVTVECFGVGTLRNGEHGQPWTPVVVSLAAQG